MVDRIIWRSGDLNEFACTTEKKTSQRSLFEATRPIVAGLSVERLRKRPCMIRVQAAAALPRIDRQFTGGSTTGPVSQVPEGRLRHEATTALRKCPKF